MTNHDTLTCEPWTCGPATLYTGDAETVLATLPDASIDCVVSSPPYWQLRDYHTGRWTGGRGDCDHVTATRAPQTSKTQPRCQICGAIWTDAQLGLETDVEDYVDRLVAIFAEVRRVLTSRGTVWLNLGDGYASTGRPRTNPPGATSITSTRYGQCRRTIGRVTGLAPKNMIGLPWTVAFALRDSGSWILRNAVVWAKTNGQPSSVRDRLTSGYEYVFLLARSRDYHFDLDAIRIPPQTTRPRSGGRQQPPGAVGKNPGDVWAMPQCH